MSHIYTQAQHVHIYLGETTPPDVPGLTLAPRLATAQTQRMRKRDVRNRFQLTWVDLESYNLPNTNSPAYPSFLSVCRRQYFSRGWVLQEAALARSITIHCGTFSFPFDEFYHALLCCCDLGFAEDIPPLEMMQVFRIGLMRQAIARGEREDLLTLMVQTRLSETTDPRDKVYALLGIARDTEAVGIKPEYEMSWIEVYRSVVIKIVEVYGDLDVLCVPKSDDTTDEFENKWYENEATRLPSWVPDWRRNPTGEAFTLTGRDQDRHLTYRAAGASRAHITLDKNDKNVLGLSGYCVDRITECGAAGVNSDNHMEGRSTVRMILDSFSFGLELRLRYIDWKHIARVYTGGEYVTGTEVKEDAFWRTLVAGYAFRSDTDFAEVKKLYREWDASLLRFGSLRSWLPRPIFKAAVLSGLVMDGLRTMFALTFWLPLYSRTGEAFTNFMHGAGHRRFVRTEKGYIGLAPKNARVGDEIALFEGGNLPFIVRKREAGERWTLLGDCYVHGMMAGEVFEREKCEIMWIE